MRSSIACVRCRRSKVKCVNNGIGTTCRSCENSGRECLYPSPVASGTRRRDSLPGRSEVYGEAAKRPRKSTHTFVANPASAAPRESPRPQVDALDPRLLTPQVWQELFEIFQVHYSADLPFLHPPTFFKPLRYATAQPPQASNFNNMEPPATARPPGSPEFLLAFLALTARFHPTLVAQHSPPSVSRASNPLIASEYYAMAANERMANCWTDNRTQAIERTQAALMLGLHEWGMCRGSKAWLTVGMAIRSAQAMGLQYEVDLDDEPMSRSLALNGEAERMGVDSGKAAANGGKSSEDVFIQQEIRRRTFWSCYIMDRYLSSGKYRPQMLHARELRIQLPASERSFLFADRVRTLMLGEDDRNIAGLGRAEVQNQRQQSVALGTGEAPEPRMANASRACPSSNGDDDKGRLETGPDEGLVSRYVKILEIYGKVVRWSCAGGRRIEEHPPWDPRCEFAKLYRQCQDFKASLPRQHTLTTQNTQAHISLKTSTPYTLVHTVYLLCQIMLHREYVPFIPIRCSKPEGPLDPPMFPPERYDVPRGFWQESARECFKSAREIMDLVRTCQEWNALVETPIVGFAIYTVAFVGVYCMNFPWMDPEEYMCVSAASKPNSSRPGGSKGSEAARKALEMIGNMRTKLYMAGGWFGTINRIHRYFRRMKADYRRNAQITEGSSDGDSPLSTRNLTLREGGLGGGLDEFKLFERTLKDFGNLEDEDVEMSDVQPGGARPLDAIYDDSSANTSVKNEEQDPRSAPGAEAPRQEGAAWSAINAPATTAPSRHASISTPSSGQFRSYGSYGQHHQQNPLHHQQQQTSYQQQQPQPHGHQGPTSQPPPQPQQQPSQPNYAHQITSFRRAYGGEAGSPAGAPPSRTSPASQSVATPSQQGASPYQTPGQQGYSWTPQNSGGWGSQDRQQAPQGYANGTPSQHPHHQLPHQSSLPSNAPSYPASPHLQPAPPMLEPPPPKPWDAGQKEAWLNSIDTRLGGDDVAAFVDGGELAEWAHLAAAEQGFGGGWLSAVWSGQGGGS